MTPQAEPADISRNALGDALLAARLFARSPQSLGGICLRGGGPARDLVLAALGSSLPQGMQPRRLPLSIDDDRLTDGIDIASSLALGRPVHQKGLLDSIAGGVLLVPMADRLDPALAGRLAQAMDLPERRFGLIMLDDGASGEETPPVPLMERVAFILDLSGIASLAQADDGAAACPGEPEVSDAKAMDVLASTAAALGIGSIRAHRFAWSAARAMAALGGRSSVNENDLQTAARLVLAPRATMIPAHEEQAAPPPPETAPEQGESSGDGQNKPADERILEAVLAAIPPDLLAQLAAGARQQRSGRAGNARRMQSKLRGKPLSARPGKPGGGARLALIDTFRAAVPWQQMRRGGMDGHADGIIVRKSDLRIRRHEQRSAAVTIFCVDASGSAAMARLAEAKGAVELMLAQAYVTRSEVALIAFRDRGAELLLPPTRSLTRARRALAQLPGGGGTPLASGIFAARTIADQVLSRGDTPFVVLLTDGSANIGADGSAGRGQARDDALRAARAVAASGHSALIVDIAPRPRAEARALAEAMQARYLPMPVADASRLRSMVETARPDRRAA